MAKALTDKQAAFVQAKLEGLSNEKAAIQAGYSLRGAKVQATALMRHPDVSKAIRSGRAKRAAKRGDSIEQALHDAGIDSGDKRLKDSYESPLDMFLDVMNNPKFPDGTRIQCAKDAMPYVNGKIGDVGKKAAVRKRAEDVAGKQSATPGRNKFAPKAPPTKQANVVPIRGGR